MESGYLVIFNSDDESRALKPPSALIPGEELDSGMNQLCMAIRSWISDHNDGPMSSMSISIVGPVDGPVRIRKTPEEALAESKTQEERFYALGDAAMSRTDAGDDSIARAHADELLNLLPVYRDNWNYGNAIAKANIVLGRLALREGHFEEAERHLIEAGTSPGSPQMDSFGPNMRLAQDLLLACRTEAVLEYFELCSRFWDAEFSRLDEWREHVLAGRIPDFGANLSY